VSGIRKFLGYNWTGHVVLKAPLKLNILALRLSPVTFIVKETTESPFFACSIIGVKDTNGTAVVG